MPAYTPSPSSIVIGEIVTYVASITVPHGQTTNLSVVFFSNDTSLLDPVQVTVLSLSGVRATTTPVLSNTPTSGFMSAFFPLLSFPITRPGTGLITIEFQYVVKLQGSASPPLTSTMSINVTSASTPTVSVAADPINIIATVPAVALSLSSNTGDAGDTVSLTYTFNLWAAPASLYSVDLGITLPNYFSFVSASYRLYWLYDSSVQESGDLTDPSISVSEVKGSYQLELVVAAQLTQDTEPGRVLNIAYSYTYLSCGGVYAYTNNHVAQKPFTTLSPQLSFAIQQNSVDYPRATPSSVVIGESVVTQLAVIVPEGFSPSVTVVLVLQPSVVGAAVTSLDIASTGGGNLQYDASAIVISVSTGGNRRRGVAASFDPSLR